MGWIRDVLHQRIITIEQVPLDCHRGEGRVVKLFRQHWRLGGSGFLPPILIAPDEQQALGDEGGELDRARLRRTHRPGLKTLGHGLGDPGAGAGAIE